VDRVEIRPGRPPAYGGVGRTRREDEAIRFRLLVPTLACRKVMTAGNVWTGIPGWLAFSSTARRLARR
jgi:hypothetical protein